MKKLVSLILLFALCLMCIGSASAATVPAGGYDGSDVTITFYTTMGANLTAVLDSYIEEFNALYPNIHIQYTSVGGYDDVRDQVSTEITVGSQPNIAYCYPDHVALYNLAYAVATLDELIDSEEIITRADGTTEILGLTDEQKADFIEGYYNEGRQFGDGLMYTMPLSKSTEVLYYNKTFFDNNNLTVPTTWEEMEAVCAQIKAIDPNSIPLGYDSESNWFITMCEQYDSPYTSATYPHFLFDNDTNRGFIKMFREWYEKGYLTTQTLYGAYTSDRNVPDADPADQRSDLRGIPADRTGDDRRLPDEQRIFGPGALSGLPSPDGRIPETGLRERGGHGHQAGGNHGIPGPGPGFPGQGCVQQRLFQ